VPKLKRKDSVLETECREKGVKVEDDREYREGKVSKAAMWR
jgi:hypothetical protein